MHQPHLTVRFIYYRFYSGDAAPRMVFKIDTPLFCKEVDIQCRARALVGNKFSDVETDPARTHNRYFFSNRFVTSDCVDVADYFFVINAGNLGYAGINAGGNHDVVEARLAQLFCTDARTQLNRDLVFLEHSAVIADRFVELFLARHLLGQIELPTNFISTIKQGYLMTPLGRHRGVGEPRRPRTNNRNLLYRRGRRPIQHGFVAGPGIDQTGRRFHRKRVIETRLVAGDTRIDFVLSALGRFFHQLGIGQHRPRHRYQIGISISQYGLGDVGHVDAIGRNHRH